jgi:hypothetical protein
MALSSASDAALSQSTWPCPTTSSVRPAAGWLRFEVWAAAALGEMRGVRQMFEQEGSERRETLEACLRCFRCGADSATLVPARQCEAPSGVTIQPVNLERG